MKPTVILFAACILLAGCVSVSTQEITALDYGSMPEQQTMEKMARGYMETTLKDPESARYKFHDARKGWQKDGSLRGGKLHAGWLLVVDVNAKNSYGGYTGFQRYYFFFENGQMYQLDQFFFDQRMAGFADETRN